MTWTGAKYFALQIPARIPSIATTLYHFRLGCLKSVCHMFFPSLQTMCLLTSSLCPDTAFFFAPFFSRWILGKSFGATLIFVWSIQSYFVFFLFKKNIFLARHLSSITQKNTHTGRKSMQIVPTYKKRKFCHVVLLLPAFDNGTKCWNSFCQGNFAIQRQCSSFFFFFLSPSCENISSIFSKIFLLFCRHRRCVLPFLKELNLLHRIAFGNWNWIFILFAFRRRQTGMNKIKLDFVSSR